MNAVALYRDNSVTTTSRGRLVVMLYDGAIKFLRQAQAAIEREDWAQKGQCIGRAQDIIAELDNALNMEVGGEITANLRKLYVFMTNTLVKASIRKDAQMIEQVIKLLEELNSGWKQIAE